MSTNDLTTSALPTASEVIALLRSRLADAIRQRDEARAELHRVRGEMRQDAEDRREEDEQHSEIALGSERAASSVREARRWLDKVEHELVGVSPEDLTREVE